MIDPKEKNIEQPEENTQSSKEKSTDKDNVNWDANQQVDEEGNQLTPDDIK